MDVNIGSIYHTEICRSGTWMLSSIDVSSLEDDDFVVRADQGTISANGTAQAMSSVSKETATPTVADLSLVHT